MHMKTKAWDRGNFASDFMQFTRIECYQLVKVLGRFRRDIDGATAVEYGLLAGLVAIGLAGGLGALSDLVNLLFENVGAETAQVTSNLNEAR